MKFENHPKIGDTVKLGFTVKKIISKTQPQTGHQIYYLCVEKDGVKRLLRYNPRTKETSASFERHTSTFGRLGKGPYKTW